MPETKRIRAAERLSALKVSKSTKAGTYEDGKGLRLLITEAGSKRWVLRLTIRGKRTDRGLGVVADVSLEDARVKAAELRAAAKMGRDVQLEEKQQQRVTAVTFRDAFTTYFEGSKRATLSPGRFAERWPESMEAYVYPSIGNRPVADVTPSEVHDILKPIWHDKRETANRVLQRMSATFKSAIFHGTRRDANPCDGVSQQLGKARTTRVVHRKALPWKAVPAFVADLRARGRVSTASELLLEAIIFSALRSEETRLAKWGEMDFEAAEWRVPGIDPVESERLGYLKKRMKMGIDHIVPISTGMLSVLQRAKVLRRNDSASALIFPNTKGTPFSDNASSKLMRDATVAGTPHGFRSSFKVWSAETGIRDEVSEAVLAHGDPDKVRGAYRRTTYFEERRVVMQRWSDFVLGVKTVADLSL